MFDCNVGQSSNRKQLWVFKSHQGDSRLFDIPVFVLVLAEVGGLWTAKSRDDWGPEKRKEYCNHQ